MKKWAITFVGTSFFVLFVCIHGLYMLSYQSIFYALLHIVVGFSLVVVIVFARMRMEREVFQKEEVLDEVAIIQQKEEEKEDD